MIMIKCKCKECGKIFDDYTAVEKQKASFGLLTYDESKEAMYCPYCDYLFIESYSQWLKRMSEPWM